MKGCYILVLVIIGLTFVPAAGLSAVSGSNAGDQWPEPLISLETGGQDSYAVVVEKKSQTLYLFKYEEGRFQQISRVPCSTGEIEGRKDRSGDKKTPEGVYFCVKEHPARDLAPIYGSRAFPIDYPNLIDRIAGRDGNSIWLHGTNKPLKPNDSNGCIVLENPQIDRLAQYITLNRTPVVVVEELTFRTARETEAERRELEAVLADWKKALDEGTYHQYLSLYDPLFLPDISWWTDWARIREKHRNEKVSFSVDIKKTAMFRSKDLVTILFDTVLDIAGQEIPVGTRKLFLNHRPEGWRIVGDEDQIVSESLHGKKEGHAMVAAARQFKAPTGDAEIVAMIDGWIDAWSSKDIKRYGSYYAVDFQSQGGADREAWIKYKDGLNRKYSKIRVTRKNKITIRKDKDRRMVSFIQTYDSSVFKATGVKKLVLKREGNQWKIYRESFNES